MSLLVPGAFAACKCCAPLLDESDDSDDGDGETVVDGATAGDATADGDGDGLDATSSDATSSDAAAAREAAAAAALRDVLLFDSHCHVQQAPGAVSARYLGVAQAVDEADWARVLAACTASPRLRPGLGAHPWQAHLVGDLDAYQTASNAPSRRDDARRTPIISQVPRAPRGVAPRASRGRRRRDWTL
mmetsp:Transcript_8999/g.28088  ORF Transcript_8999/g.28088 Transcript_8999/m.28088 type:complete len:188 (-) Transcript_8999:494-1057(-)